MPAHTSEPAIADFDLTIGRHPSYGIVAVASGPFAGTAWMLDGFDFHPVPDHHGMFVLANQHHEPNARATRAVDLLRRAGYQVHADLALDPDISLPTRNFHAAAPPEPPRRPADRAPDVAFAEHPRLGIVAATTDDARSAERAGQILHEHGFRYRATWDVYDLPPDLDRKDTLHVVAQTAPAMNRAGLEVAVQPALAAEATAHSTLATTDPALHERNRPAAPPRFPALDAAALTISPARASLPGASPGRAPTAAPASGSADPRITFSRSR
jgi:hypothetical protein